MDLGAGGDVLVWSPPFDIEMDWLDANGHLNMAFYNVMFDRTVDLALDALGCGHAYRATHNASVFNVETHIVYRREVLGNDKVRVSFQLLGRDEQRLHGYQQMVRLGDGELVASCESLFVHVDLADRHAAALPVAVAVAADAMVEAHRTAGEPHFAGRRITPLASLPPA
ncbi:MAG: thioesterase family protein [Acuticoccus sp.]